MNDKDFKRLEHKVNAILGILILNTKNGTVEEAIRQIEAIDEQYK